MQKVTLDLLRKVLQKKGYVWLDDGRPFHLNIIGIRTEDNSSNLFNDWICYAYRDEKGAWQLSTFKATTDPGTYWRQNPENVKGVAILQPGQHLDCWVRDLHQGKYPALVQRGAPKPMSVYRDNDRNALLGKVWSGKGLNYEGLKLDVGYFGINNHRANAERESTQVDKWSAGCQVLANPVSFGRVMGWVEASLKVRANRFSYTLLEEKDLSL